MAGHVVKVTLVADTVKMQRAFKNLARQTGLEGFVSRAKATAATIAKVTGAAGLALGAMATKAVSAAADLEQSTGSVQAVFKDTASTIKRFASTASTSVGLTTNDYQQLATVLGAQLKNGGTAMDQLAGKTNDLIGLGADLSAMFGGTTADAVAALSSALKGERDPIERYGVSLRQASIDAKAAELGFADVSSPAAQQAATLALIMQQTTDAQGAFAREGGTLAHQTQVLKAQLGDLAAKIGTVLLPYVTQAVTWLNDHFTPAVQTLKTWAQDNLVPALSSLGAELRDRLGPALKTAADVFTTRVLPALKDVVQWVGQNAPPALRTFKQLFDDWGPSIGAAAGVLATFYAGFQAFQRVKAILSAARLAFSALSAVMAANPMVLVAIAVAALVAAIVHLYQHNETARRIINAAWGAIRSALGSTANWVRSTAIPSIIGAINRLAAIPGNMAAWFGRARSAAASALGGLVTTAAGIPGRVVSALGSLGSRLYSAGQDLVRGMINGVSSMVGALADKARSMASSAVSAAKRALGINSPSRVMRQLGIYTGQGWIDGLDAMTKQATQAMGDLVAVPNAPTINGKVNAASAATAPTIIVQALAPSPEIGRQVSAALSQWQAINGKR